MPMLYCMDHSQRSDYPTDLQCVHAGVVQLSSHDGDVSNAQRPRGKVLFENKNYVFASSTSPHGLTTFLQEDPAAQQRLSRDFAKALVADVLESF